MKKRSWLLAVGFLLAAGSAGGAQDSVAMDTASSVEAASPAGATRHWQIGAWAGASFRSRFATRQGSRYRDLYMVGVRFVHAAKAPRDMTLDYYVDLVPIIRSTNTPTEYRWECSGSVEQGCTSRMITETVPGFGITPIGLQLRTFTSRKVQLTFSLGLGAAWYQRPIPDPDERQLNFMGDVGVGLQFELREAAVLAGIRHSHTSNGGTGNVNPGLDSRVLYLGAVRPFGRRAKQ